MAASFLIFAYRPQQETGTTPQTDRLFEQSLQEFANTIAVDDGKYFLLDDKCNLSCLDAETGNLSWQTNLGHWRAGGILVKNGTIYYGTGAGAVQAIDEDTGDFLRSYASMASITGWGLKSPPAAFSVCDGHVFIEHNGCVAYDAATGEMLWKSYPVTMLNPPEMPYTSKVWAFDNKLVLCEGSFPYGDSSIGIYRINPDKGTPIWGVEGSFYQEPLIYENKVILPNYGTTGIPELSDKVIAVTVSSGVKIWSYDVGAPIYKPVMFGDKLLFVAEDGYCYALNLSNGTLAWKTPLAKGVPSGAAISSVALDMEKQELFWACGTTRENGSDSSFIYDCTLFRLNVTGGQNLTKTQWQSNTTGPFFTRNNPIIGLALLNNSAYLSVQNDLWVFSRSTLMPLKMEHFDHLLAPIAAYNRVYVSADLSACAYKDLS
ncbi:MAG TPA: PQQ-binding-like beta-propeller repeat protein [Candidatus Acidoferrales bacterium]|nr:PQQ-binding-like beta-propeller repeat protein [Candidatus Acidoferrales bacterium]